MKNVTVYLAGPISGLTYVEATEWRNQVKEIVGGEVLVRDPMDKVQPRLDDAPFQWQKPELWEEEGGNTRGQVFHDDIEAGVLASDVVLVGYPTGFMSSGGTAFELGVAYAYGIPTILWNPKGDVVHPFLDFPVAYEENELREACADLSALGLAPNTFEAALSRKLHDLRQLMLDRQHKYGPENIRSGGKHGLIVRMMDKMARIVNQHPGLVCGGSRCPTDRDFSDETELDAFRDLGDYSGVIMPMVMDDTWGLPLLADTIQKEENNA